MSLALTCDMGMKEDGGCAIKLKGIKSLSKFTSTMCKLSFENLAKSDANEIFK